MQRPPQSVEVFTTAAPNHPYVEIGVFEARQESAYSHSGQTAIIDKMRKEAAKIGCDALVINGSADKVVGGGSTSNGYGSSSVTTLKGYRGTCIVYRPVAPVAAAPPPVQTAAHAPMCVPGSTLACTGAGGCKGGQACTADGTGYSPCDCGPSPSTTAPSASAVATPSAPPAGVAR